VERIVGTALEMIDESGADALSMRALAQRLDSGTATLYRHFADRTELIAAIVDRVFGEVELDERRLRAMRWQSSCRTVAVAMFDALRRHRNVAPLLVEMVPIGPNALRLREQGLANLLANGFSAKRAVLTWATLAHYVLGFAIQVGRRDAHDGNPARLSAILNGLDASRFPATVAAAGAMPIPIEQEFSFGLDLMIKGLGDTPKRRSRRTGRLDGPG
jgi:AcrR family transcriptional regulator